MVQCDTVRDGLEGGCYFYKIARDKNNARMHFFAKKWIAVFFLFYILSLSLMKNNLWLFLINTFFTLDFRKHTFSLCKGSRAFKLNFKFKDTCDQ